MNTLDSDALVADLAAQVEHWNSRGSGFVMERITNFVLVITKYRPLCGSTYIPTPQWLANKHCAVNVKHEGVRCFVYAILSALHPAADHPDRISNYRKYENTLNVTGLTFPLAVRDVPKFEALNPDTSVNVLCEVDDEGCVPLYVSKQRNRRHHINLFLLEGTVDQGNELQHYVWIKNMSRLVRDQSKHVGATFVCNSCLHPFRDKEVLERRIPNCERHPLKKFGIPTTKTRSNAPCNSEIHEPSFVFPSTLCVKEYSSQ